MKYRLGLDVGTASCGLVALELDAEYKPIRPAYNSLDIWSEPLQPAKSGGVGQPKKAARRAARMARRGICRRARRLRHIVHLAPLLGLQPASIAPDVGQKIHRLRAQATEERIDLDDLLRVLLRLAKNRGPSGDWVYAEPDETKKEKRKSRKVEPATDDAESNQSNEAAQKSAEEKKSIVGGVRKLEGLMHEAAAALGKSELTLGQYLAYRFDRGEGVLIGKPHIGLYPSRKVVETEFNRIWDKQAEFHPVLRDAGTRQKFFNAIFHQRPLKSPAPMVGRCPLEPTLPRAPAAQMAAQAFRIEKQLADLRWGMGKHAQRLSLEQKAVVRGLLNEQAEVNFSAIRKALEEAGLPSPNGRGLNMDRASRDKLKGNSTLAAMRKLGLDAEWGALHEKTQIQVINFLADLGSPDALENDDWQTKFRKLEREKNDRKYKKPIRVSEKQWKYTERDFEAPFVAFINRLRAHPKFGRLSAMDFDGGRMGYSIKALKRLTELMQAPDKDGVLYDERAAVDHAYPEHNKPRALSSTRPLPPETGNTVVDVALRQVYRAVQRAMEALGGPPAQVIVELSRDMALGVTKRGEIENKIKKNTKVRLAAKKTIQEHGNQGADTEINRYLLWDQQQHYCPYCDKRIELGEALSGSETNFEHILPRTLTRVGGKRSQLVLAHKTCNNEKGNRTPWQAFHGDATRWRIIQERAAQLEKNSQWGKAKLLLLEGWEGEVLNDDAIKDFTDRQFHESSWIAKLTAQWLRGVCSDVSVSRGELTAHLRRIWKLDTVIPEVRYAQDLPVLDRTEKPQPISLDDFKKHKSWWEGHDERAGGVPTDRKPDKRIDHRHHLLDALVISLTDRKLFEEMAKNYKREREKERQGQRAKLGLYKDPPITALRDLAVEIVTNAEVRHRQDRHLDGKLFKDTAYTKICIDDDETLALRKSLTDRLSPDADLKAVRKLLRGIQNSSLRARLLESVKTGVEEGLGAVQALAKPEEQLAAHESLSDLVKDKKLTVEKACERILSIVSPETRRLVSEAFERRIEQGKTPQEAFAEPIINPQYNTEIKRVLTLARNRGIPISFTGRSGRHFKYLVSEDYAYLEVPMIDISKSPRLVERAKAVADKQRKMPGWERFYKNDTVRFETDGLLYVIRKFDNRNKKLICIRDTETAPNVDYVKKAEGRRDFSGDDLRKLTVINRV